MEKPPQALPLGAEDWGYPNCRECGYSWDTAFHEARSLIESTPVRYAELLKDSREPRSKPDDRTWSPSGYVWHLSDWFRIQGQRIYAIAHDPDFEYAKLGSDPDGLNDIFKYDEQSTPGGLWALEQATKLAVLAIDETDPKLVFVHPDGPKWTVLELVVYLGHESVHHELDIRRGLGLS